MRDKINADLKEAMKAGEKDRVATLRLVNAAIKSAEIEARPKDKISDADILAVHDEDGETAPRFDRAVHGRRTPRFGRQGAAEIAMIEAYMPKQMSEADAKAAIADAIKETGAAGPKDMGKVMGVLKAKYAGQMDFGKASAAVKAAAEASAQRLGAPRLKAGNLRLFKAGTAVLRASPSGPNRGDTICLARLRLPLRGTMRFQSELSG